MATNNFLQFCPTDTGTNLLTQAEYIASGGRTGGNVPGVASSKLNNKALRQATVIASQVAQYISNKLNQDMIDDGTTTTIQGQIVSAFGRLNYVSTPGSLTLDPVGGDVYLFSAAAVATLPSASTCAGKIFYIINDLGTHTTTLATTGGETIGGYASGAIVLSLKNQIAAVYSNGGTWVLLNNSANNVLVSATVLDGGTDGVTTIASGTFTPSWTNLVNVTSLTSTGTGYWKRQGKVVTMWGAVDLQPTAASTYTAFDLQNLPVTTGNFGSALQASGNTQNNGSILERTGFVKANPGTQNLTVGLMVGTFVGSDTQYFHAYYEIQ